MLIDFSSMAGSSRYRQLGTRRDYDDTSYTRPGDSRIVGGDFVVLSLRKDPWFDKVDKHPTTFATRQLEVRDTIPAVYQDERR